MIPQNRKAAASLRFSIRYLGCQAPLVDKSVKCPRRVDSLMKHVMNKFPEMMV